MKIRFVLTEGLSYFLNIFMVNFLRLTENILDEPSRVEFLQQHRIIQAQRFCKDGRKMKLCLDAQDRWRCSLKRCRQNKGLCSNNWLVFSRLPFRKVIFVYSWSRRRTSFKFLEAELEIGKNAVVDWNNYLREVCA